MLQSTKTHFKNELLRRLTPGDLSLLEPHFERVTLKLKTVLQRPGAPIEFVYFPENCVASLVARMPRGRDAEVGVIGFEGMTGTPIVMGDDRQPCECVIQLPGDATRLPAKAMAEAIAASPTLRLFLLRYVQSLSTQTSFTALVNARSKLEERLARWLLMFADRVDGEELELTHEYLSIMLGVRRPGVTVAIQVLEGKGFIRAKRGVVIIRDREGLMELANGAYGVPEGEYERLVGKLDSRIG
jgi:CRP-like cAMP-binding protein